jgi:MFS family permease
MGWWSFAGAGAPVIGLVVGGPLVDLVGWRWLFGIQPPLAVPGLLLAFWVLRPDEQPHERPRFDVAGSILLGAAMGSFLFGLNQSAAYGWSDPKVWVPMAITPVFGYAFVRAERRHPEPLIRFSYFRRRDVSIPMILIGLSHVPYMGTFFLSPFLLHDVLQYDNARTALALVPRPLANSLASATAGYVAVKLGERFSAVTGMGAMAGGLFVLAAVGASSSFGQVVLALVLTGAGMGLAFPGLMSTIANSVDERDFGAVSAAQEMLMMVGMTIGMQGMQTLHAARARSVGNVAAYHDAFIVGAVLCVLATVIAFGVRSMHRSTPVPPTESPESPYLAERVT